MISAANSLLTVHLFSIPNYTEQDLKNIKSDVVATFKNGKFTFHGLKPALLGIKDKDNCSEKCELCLEPEEFCGLALTRNQKKMNEQEDMNANYEIGKLLNQNVNSPKYPVWRAMYSKISTFGTADMYGCLNLVDPGYSVKSTKG